MLEINIPKKELWDAQTQQFINFEGSTLRLEHSLVSLSKWEMKYKTPFLTKKEKTYDETLYYIKCMTLTQNVKEITYKCLTQDNISDINAYISDPMTATTIKSRQSSPRGHGEIVTAEIIYYWMTALSIPFECQKWHLNRLFMLIQVCSIKSQPPKKMNRRQALSKNAALNAARRQKYNTRG